MTNKEQQCHELALYFLMKPSVIAEINHQSYCLDDVKENVYWLPIDRLGEYEAYPTFFKDELLNLPQNVKHIVTKE